MTTNKAGFFRKVDGLKELQSLTARNKDEKENCVIEKVIELSNEDFTKFTEDFFEDKEFITENIDLMYTDENSIWHTIMVVTEGNDIGILVESEGYDYARYTAVVDKRKVTIKGQTILSYTGIEETLELLKEIECDLAPSRAAIKVNQKGYNDIQIKLAWDEQHTALWTLWIDSHTFGDSAGAAAFAERITRYSELLKRLQAVGLKYDC